MRFTTLLRYRGDPGLHRLASRRFVMGACVVGCALGLQALAAATSLLWPSRDVPEFAAVRSAWRPSEAYLLDRRGEVIDSLRVDFGVRRFEWVELSAISPALIAAIVDGEDRRFWKHAGVDWAGALTALGGWTQGRGRGASTITMQLAGMIDARVGRSGPRGSWHRKLAQIRSARGIETRWTKAQILEAYLNLLDFRGELQGVGAAAQVLARKAPSGLDLSESVVLAALLPSPGAAIERVVARACARSQARRLLLTCDNVRSAAARILDRAAQLNLREERRLAPHVARALLGAPGERVRTTLDARLQRIATEVLERQVARLATQNVRDGAAIVVDNASGEVLAYVGSAGPRSRARQVDGVRARRQAGSTLKPFLYELALERRLLTAASLLDDSPLHLETVGGVYLPQDYDRNYQGLVSVRTALASSLNIPAVRTLVLVGVEPFRTRLHDVGYAGIVRDGSYYGYSLALGSAEVSLWEQAQAYRALARGGRSSPLRLRAADAPAFVKPHGIDVQRPGRALAADASFVTADILSDKAARALTFGLDNHLTTPYWSAVKTGTSKDMRDNWCIGFSQAFTVAVWVGNFEGDSMHDVSGVSGAAPAWQELMAAAHAGQVPPAPAAPAGVRAVATGFSPALEPPRHEWFLADTHSPRVVALAARDEIPRIASPTNGMVIAIDPDIPPRFQRLPLRARGSMTAARLILDGREMGSASEGVLWAPQPGTHRLVLADAAGTPLDQIVFTVR
jgi:penicillin-binding protein 1C